MSAAVAGATGCGGGGGGATGATGATPPDRLSVTLQGGGVLPLRFDLDCGVADTPACAVILTALGDAQEDARCVAAPGDDDASLLVSGTIDGEPVRARLSRRTDCEIRTYDRVVAGLGL